MSAVRLRGPWQSAFVQWSCSNFLSLFLVFLSCPLYLFPPQRPLSLSYIFLSSVWMAITEIFPKGKKKIKGFVSRCFILNHSFSQFKQLVNWRPLLFPEWVVKTLCWKKVSVNCVPASLSFVQREKCEISSLVVRFQSEAESQQFSAQPWAISPQIWSNSFSHRILLVALFIFIHWERTVFLFWVAHKSHIYVYNNNKI